MTWTVGDYTDKIQCPQGAYNLVEKISTKYIRHDSFTHLLSIKNLLSTYYATVLSNRSLQSSESS